MLNKINHSKFFFHALRSALLVIVGFLTYELLKILESEWNKKHPSYEITHFAQRKTFHFIIIFIADLFILYLIALLFNIHL